MKTATKQDRSYCLASEPHAIRETWSMPGKDDQKNSKAS
jgi:hypothetical protein